MFGVLLVASCWLVWDPLPKDPIERKIVQIAHSNCDARIESIQRVSDLGQLREPLTAADRIGIRDMCLSKQKELLRRRSSECLETDATIESMRRTLPTFCSDEGTGPPLTLKSITIRNQVLYTGDTSDRAVQILLATDILKQETIQGKYGLIVTKYSRIDGKYVAFTFAREREIGPYILASIIQNPDQ